jgi:hypothetical protein
MRAIDGGSKSRNHLHNGPYKQARKLAGRHQRFRNWLIGVARDGGFEPCASLRLLAQVLRSPQGGEAFVNEHATGDLWNLRPSLKVTVGKDGVRGRARAGLPRRHAINDVSNARPPNRVTAQHARFDGGIERAAAQIKRIEALAGLAYGFHFGVRARVECRPGALDAFTHDFVAADDQGANRGVAAPRRDLCQLQTPSHVHRCLHSTMVAWRDDIALAAIAPAATPSRGHQC